jgi:hypothetical protein
MPLLKDKDFDKIAETIVNRYLNDKVKLADAAAEMAMQNNMNPDQVQRMIEAANTLTFLRLMDQAKAQQKGDLTEEFEPIDHSQVMQSMLGPSAEGGDLDGDGDFDTPEIAQCEQDLMAQGVPHEEAEAPCHGKGESMQGGLADGMADEEFDPDQLEEGATDEAEEHTEDPEQAKEIAKDHLAKDPKYYKKQKKNKKEAAILGRRKLAESLKSERLALDYDFDDGVNSIAREFKKVYAPSFTLFEKDAMAEYGPNSLPVLNAIRQKLGMPERTKFDAGTVKIATVNGLIEQARIVDDTPTLKKMGSVMELVAKAIKLDAELSKLGDK